MLLTVSLIPCSSKNFRAKGRKKIPILYHGLISPSQKLMLHIAGIYIYIYLSNCVSIYLEFTLIFFFSQFSVFFSRELHFIYIHISIYLYIYPSTYLSILLLISLVSFPCLSPRISCLYLFIYLPKYPSIYISLFFFFVHQLVFFTFLQRTSLHLHLFSDLHIFFFLQFVQIYISIHLSHLPTYPSIYLLSLVSFLYFSPNKT